MYIYNFLYKWTDLLCVSTWGKQKFLKDIFLLCFVLDSPIITEIYH